MSSNRSLNLRRLLSASALVLATSLACLYAPSLPPRITDEGTAIESINR